MAVEFPRRHIERLIKVGADSDGPATRLSATVVESWLDSLNYEDPVAVLGDVMSALGQLPSCTEDFLGNELYDWEHAYSFERVMLLTFAWQAIRPETHG